MVFNIGGCQDDCVALLQRYSEFATSLLKGFSPMSADLYADKRRIRDTKQRTSE